MTLQTIVWMLTADRPIALIPKHYACQVILALTESLQLEKLATEHAIREDYSTLEVIKHNVRYFRQAPGYSPRHNSVHLWALVRSIREQVGKVRRPIC